jgi:hypothetical protein
VRVKTVAEHDDQRLVGRLRRLAPRLLHTKPSRESQKRGARTDARDSAVQQSKRRPHWVSQFLTAPWEVNEKRDLAFFDFLAGHLGKPTPSKRLFRETRKRSADLEERLNRLIETPFARARGVLLARGDLQIDEWETYRAVALLVMMQPARRHASVAQDDAWLEQLLVSDQKVDELVQLYMTGRRLIRLGSTLPEHALFYPDGGMFGFLTKDTGCLTQWAWGIAVPVTPSIAFASISDTADWEWLREATATTPHLQAFSLAGPPDARIVVPPDLVARARSTPRWLVEHRAKMNELRSALEAARDKIVGVHQAYGHRVVQRPDRSYALAEGGSESAAVEGAG